ncbi:tRNAHis guanylyltransferase-domain-containing protein [Thelonectria olida]|uniref:tRNA(His) guanylyltransferase n=1 Tax=Thelonectria olida TaxID=1576542 RepID=A0A9P8VXK4_9HYPO|nr:tRNAHis guanylyltransferase-domain-containing protein [Thelonectria olida]
MASHEPPKSLATRMKDYEAATEIHLAPSQPAILRLDGHAFSKFTAPFAKPFDERLHTAMVKTCADLLDAYPAATLAYTQSDEITLVFPEGVGSFNGRVMKIATLAAGVCSVHFYSHLMAALAETPEPAVKGFASLPLPYFDGRICNVPSVEECVNNILWRCRGDAVRNSVSAFARSLFSTKQLHGKNKDQMVEMAEKEKGVTYEQAVPKWALEGSIVKKYLVKMEAVDMKTGEPVTVVRTRTRCEDRGMMAFSDENLALVRDRYWPEA